MFVKVSAGDRARAAAAAAAAAAPGDRRQRQWRSSAPSEFEGTRRRNVSSLVAGRWGVSVTKQGGSERFRLWTGEWAGAGKGGGGGG